MDAVPARFIAAVLIAKCLSSIDSLVLGIVTEKFVRRRYAEELDKAQRDLFGES